MGDPTRLDAIDAVRFNTGLNIEPWLPTKKSSVSLSKKILDSSSNASMEGLDDDLENLDISGGDDSDKKDKDIVGAAEEEAPIVKYINKVLLDAIKMGASDLHFEPYEKAYRYTLSS